jgi:hypothetical protein
MKLTEAMEIIKGVTEVLGAAPTPGCGISRQAFEAGAKILQEPKEMING